MRRPTATQDAQEREELAMLVGQLQAQIQDQQQQIALLHQSQAQLVQLSWTLEFRVMEQDQELLQLRAQLHQQQEVWPLPQQPLAWPEQVLTQEQQGQEEEEAEEEEEGEEEEDQVVPA